MHKLEADIAHVNRVSMLGELAASLAHEIKQPLSAIILNAKACQHWIDQNPSNTEQARASTKRIEQDGNRAIEVIERVRSLYKKDAPDRREPVDLSQLVQEMIMLLRGEATRNSVACGWPSKGDGGSCATAAGVYQSRAQCNRSHEGQRGRTDDRVTTDGW